jgi:SAM-dependent methyltransferase
MNVALQKIHPRQFAAIVRRLRAHFAKPPDKYEAEIHFRRVILERYREWYNGRIPELCRVPPPAENQKIRVRSELHSVILTYLEQVQKRVYLADLKLDATALAGLRVLDIGSGPMPSATCFEDIDLYCLDPLLSVYVQMGFPLHYFTDVRFVQSCSEDMPFDDNFFDAVISVNAIDHVDDFAATAKEIRRVLKPGGRLRMHIHYHRKTSTEPLELTDEIVAANYGWCEGFRPIHRSTEKFAVLAKAGESYNVWSNF